MYGLNTGNGGRLDERKRTLGSLELNRIYQMDCIEGMRLLPEDSIDLIIADPPYGVNYRSNFRKNKFDRLQNDDVILLSWIDEAFRVLKNGGAFYCYTRWDVYPKWFEKISEKFKVKNTIIWYKKGGGLGDLKGAYIFNHEFIIYATKGRHILNGKRENDVWEVKKDNVSSYLHPTQKPVELGEKIIRKSSDECGVVLIPFAGSGSECVAALRNNRHFIGFEREPEYVRIANQRLENVYDELAERKLAEGTDVE